MLRQNQLITVKLADLKPDPTNPNVMSKEQKAGLRKSYQKFGALKFLVVDQNLTIVDGHQRLPELQALGETETQAIQIHIENEAERVLVRQTLNKLQGEHDRKLDANDFLLLFQNQQLGELAELLAKPQEECHGKQHGMNFSKYGKWLTCENCDKRFRPLSGRLTQRTCSRTCGYTVRDHKQFTGKKSERITVPEAKASIQNNPA